MRTVQIEVTADDIANGKPYECVRCPIALAMKRAGIDQVAVGDRFFCFGPGGPEDPNSLDDAREHHVLPPEAGRFVDRFDSLQPVEPFSFNVEIP